MSVLDTNILIQNIKKLMEDTRMTQAALAKILDMQQSNVSKALSDTDKKNFTLEQVIKIANHFNVSIDSLVGNTQVQVKDPSLTPRAIAEYFVRLIEHKDVAIFKHEVEEDIHEVDFDFKKYDEVHRHYTKTVRYNAFFFPAYDHIPDEISPMESQMFYEYMVENGNANRHYQTNNFFHQYLQIYKSHKQGAIEEDTYRIVVADLLNHLED